LNSANNWFVPALQSLTRRTLFKADQLTQPTWLKRPALIRLHLPIVQASRTDMGTVSPTGDKMKPESKKYTATVGHHTLTYETGKLAGQAGGAVTFGTAESIVFAAATMGGIREGIDFFPLSWNTKSACMPADGSPVRSSVVKAAPAPMRS
jgi:hypothetical protein